MTGRRVIDAVVEPSGSVYAGLLTWAASLAATFGLIVRSPAIRLSEEASSLLLALDPYLLSSEEVGVWPGTQLVGDRLSRLYRFRLTTESLVLILGATSDLYEWVNPRQLEDLHLLREDGSTVLASVAQEGEAWLELDDHELQLWRNGASEELQACFRER